MDEAPAGAHVAPIRAAHPLRRWALRAGVVLGFAAGAWLLGSFTAAAETPDAFPPESAGGLLGAVHDNALDLVRFAAAGAGDHDANGATASPAAATGAGRGTVELPAVTLAVPATHVDSAVPAGLATDRITPTTPSARAGAKEAPPTADGAGAAHQPATVDDAVTVPVHITGIRVAVESPIDATVASQVRPALGADFSVLPTLSLTAPVTGAIRPGLGAIGAALTLTPATEPLPSMTDTLAVTLTEVSAAAAATVDPADGNLVARLALPHLSSAAGGEALRGASAPVESAAAKDVDSRGDAPMPTQFPAAPTGAHGVIAIRAGADPVPPMVLAHPAAESAEAFDSPADPKRDQPPRSPAPPAVSTAGAGAESATHGGLDRAAWAAVWDVSRPDSAIRVRASDQLAALDRACDPGFSPD